MQKIISILTTILILTVVFTTSAHADRKTMEGFILGTGVAILGAAIIHEINSNSEPRYVSNHSWYDNRSRAGHRYGHKKRHHKKYNNNRPRGHWKIEKRWIEPVYKTKWNPGHYNRRGSWIDGRYEKFIIAKGCWQENKIWIGN